MLIETSNFNLTRREKHVLHLLAEGQTCKQISEILQIAESTIKTYKKRLKSKLDVSSSLEMIYVASKVGLI